MIGQYDVGIDYLTITSRSEADISGFVEAFLHSIPCQATGKPFHWMGYTGEVYVADDGHLAWGIKAGHGLAQMSGAWSDKIFRNLEQFRLMNYKCTRLDLAVTVCLPAPAQLVQQAMASGRIGEGNYTAITKRNGEGGTLYIGCRASDAFGRLYDKGAEIRSRLNKSSIPNRVLWRYEVEYKRSKAVEQRDALAIKVRSGQSLDGEIAKRVWLWFTTHNVAPRFSWEARESSVVQVATRVTNADKTLDWFRTQVRPAIKRIAPEVENAAILEALGIEKDHEHLVRFDRGTATAYQLGLWEFGTEPL